MLFYGLEAIADAGITEVGIIVGDTADEIREAVGDGFPVRHRGHLHPAGRATGLASRRAHRPGLPRDDDFVMYLGDKLHRRRHHTAWWRSSAPSGPTRRSC
ncbi:hypothetical protein GCM10023238_28590 [Streptomyces heliomycini]